MAYSLKAEHFQVPLFLRKHEARGFSGGTTHIHGEWEPSIQFHIMTMFFKIKIRTPESYREEVDCMTGCPVSTDAGMFVPHAGQGRFAEGYLTAWSLNPFASSCGRVCAAPCEDRCQRGRIDKPVSIRFIKKYLCEKVDMESTHPETVQSLFDCRLPDASFGALDVANLEKLKE